MNANITCCLMVSYVLSNMLFYFKTRPHVPPNFHYPLWNVMDGDLLHTFMRQCSATLASHPEHDVRWPPCEYILLCHHTADPAVLHVPPLVSTSALPLNEHSSPHTYKASIVHFNHPHLKFVHPICYQIT